MYGLSIIDLIVIGVYVVVIIGIGIWAGKRITNQEDYLLGGRKFGKLVQTFASFGQATSADGPVGVATTTFRNGAAGIWSSLLMVFSTPLFWITAPWHRRMRILTMGDFYEERYNSKLMGGTYAIVATVGMMGLLSVGYTAMNKTIMAITPKEIHDFTPVEKVEYEKSLVLHSLEARDYETLNSDEREQLRELRQLNPQSVFSYINESLLVWIVCFVIIIYAVMGGLEAAFYTDMLQGFLIIVLSLILIPFSWFKIKAVYGSNSGESALQILHQKLPDSFFDVFGSPTLIDFTWYFIITASLVAGITVVTQPNQLVTNAAAKDEYSARFGFVTGGFLKRFCTILWGMLGLSAILLYSGTIQNSDLVWGHATRDLLGPLNLGLVGLMVASMMAALMSTADALMLTVSGLITHNVYRHFVKNASEKHYVWIGRIAGGLFLVGGAFIATQFDSILEILKFVWEFFVIFAAAFWLGLKWRRANRQGAWVSIILTLLVFYLIPIIISTAFPSVKKSEFLLIQTQPQPIEQSYVAREYDVVERLAEIELWNDNYNNGIVQGEAPKPLVVGEKFSKKYEHPSKAIFWSKQPSIDENGQLQARGYFYPELVVISALGVDLQKLPFAMNESIRMLIRLVFPFIILIIISLLTVPQSDERSFKFFLKMRTRVRGLGKEVDDLDLEKTFSNPEESNKILLFPNSNLEVYRWNKQDFVGFFISLVVVFVVIGTLVLFVSLGS